MFCSNCGKNIADGSKFCRYCGAPVMPAEEFETKAEEVKTPTEEIKPEQTEPVRESRSFDEFKWDVQDYPAGEVEKTEDVDFNWNANPDDIKDRFTSGLSKKEAEEVITKLNGGLELSPEDIFPKHRKPAPAASVTADSTEMSAVDRIGKFNTFERKNEEFQELLNKEYRKIKMGDPIASELSAAENAADERFRAKKEEPTMEEFLRDEGVHKLYEPKAFESDVLQRIERQEAKRERERQEAEALRAEIEKAEAEAKARAEEEARLKAIEEAKAKAKVEEEARLKAEEEARAKAEAEARMKAEEEAKARQEAERAQIEAERARIEEEARHKAEEEAKLKAEEEARLKAEEEARLREEAEAELKRRAEEEARLRAEEEEKLRIIQEARMKAEEEARLKAEEEARLRAEEEQRAKIEAELKEAQEAARIRARQEAKLAAEEERRFHAEAERRRREEEILRAKMAEEDAAAGEELERERAAQEARNCLENTARIKAEEAEKIKAAVAGFQAAPAADATPHVAEEPSFDIKTEIEKAHVERREQIKDMTLARDTFFAELEQQDKADDMAKTRVMDKKDMTPNLEMTRRISKEELKVQEDRNFFESLVARAAEQEALAQAEAQQPAEDLSDDDFLKSLGGAFEDVAAEDRQAAVEPVEEHIEEGFASKDEPTAMPEIGAEEEIKPGLDNTMVMPEMEVDEASANDFDNYGKEEADKYMEQQENQADSYDEYEEEDGEEKEPSGKGRLVLKIILIVLIVIFALELVGIGIKWVAPDSAPAQVIDKSLNKVIHLITGDEDADYSA